MPPRHDLRERSVNPRNLACFLSVDADGNPTYTETALFQFCVCPAVCF